jgi:hypothetical protein
MQNEPASTSAHGAIQIGQAAEGVGEHSHPPPNVAGRRNLRYFESRPPATDFETWQQAETALQSCLSVKELVHREFVRDFGPDSVQCAAGHRVLVVAYALECALRAGEDQCA